jgi:thiamine biosynthesis lipoprotein
MSKELDVTYRKPGDSHWNGSWLMSGIRALSILAMLMLFPALYAADLDFKPGILSKEIKRLSGKNNVILIPILLNQRIDTTANVSSGEFFEVDSVFPLKYAYVGRVNTCRAGGCRAPGTFTGDEAFEFFDYFILFDSQGIVRSVRVFNYEATHGQEITVHKWLNQFVGYDGRSALIPGKHVNAISGATISVYSIIDDIQNQTGRLQSFLRQSGWTVMGGKAQGTSWSLRFNNTGEIQSLENKIDSIFKYVDNTFSLYNPESLLSRINRNERDVLLNELFNEIYWESFHISEITGGAFDITCGSRYYTQFSPSDRSSLFTYKDLKIENNMICKPDTAVKLDFNAIAQGKTVDMVADLLLQLGIWDFIFELGGELRCHGRNSEGKAWQIGVDKPLESADHSALQAVDIESFNTAVATSGNYRNFVFQKDQKKGHIIDPFTGKSATTDLLSVTILSDRCSKADALATACVVMGFEKCKAFLATQKEIRAYLTVQPQTGEQYRISLP